MPPRLRFFAPLAALALVAGCATPFQARVSRFQQLPATTGQTFVVQATDRAKANSLEFQSYATLVEQRLYAQGYRPATDPRAATLVVNLDYGVGEGREKIYTRPGYGSGFGYGGFGYGGFGYGALGYPGYGFYGRGRYGFRGGGFGGFYDPFWGSPFGQPEITSVTQYPAYLTMKIERVTDNASVFEGRAESTVRDNDLTKLVPNLVAAMFQNFPGRSGETVRVKVDPKAQARAGA